jgi:hypothetical protein
MTGYEAVGPVPPPDTEAIRQQFPGVRAWYGQATGSWWALVPVRGGPRLVEALNPRELREAIENAAGWPWPTPAHSRGLGLQLVQDASTPPTAKGSRRRQT